MSNEQRAQTAANAIDTFTREVFGGRDFEKTVAIEGPEVVIGDFLCDLQHLCHLRGWDFADLLRRGDGHFTAEVDGEED